MTIPMTRTPDKGRLLVKTNWFSLKRLCLKMICIKMVGYEYKVKLLFSQQLFYTGSISSDFGSGLFVRKQRQQR